MEQRHVGRSREGKRYQRFAAPWLWKGVEGFLVDVIEKFIEAKIRPLPTRPILPQSKDDLRFRNRDREKV
jgi:hypothetical protein